MVSLPPRAQLRSHNSQNFRPQDEGETSGTVQSRLPTSQIFDCLSNTAALPQSSEPAGLSGSILMTDTASLERSSIYSADSPLGGSTLYPTPQSTQHQPRNDHLNSMKYKNTESDQSYDQLPDPISYAVEVLESQDDAHRMTPWKSRIYRLSPFTTLISMVAYFSYYTYRIHCTLDAQRVFNQAYVMAWIFICAEGCVACESIGQFFTQS